MTPYRLGADVAQWRDATAIVCTQVLHGERFRLLDAGTLERAAPETQAAAIARVAERFASWARATVSVYLDASADRGGVTGLLRPRLAGIDAVLIPVEFSAGDFGAKWDATKQVRRVDKHWCYAQGLRALEQGRVAGFVGPDGKLSPRYLSLRAELATLQVEQTPSGRETFNARSGRHDDLVTALALTTMDPPIMTGSLDDLRLPRAAPLAGGLGQW